MGESSVTTENSLSIIHHLPLVAIQHPCANNSEDRNAAIRTAERGEAVRAPVFAAGLMGRMRAPAEEALSEREIEMLALVARGASSREIAHALHINEATAKSPLIQTQQHRRLPPKLLYWYHRVYVSGGGGISAQSPSEHCLTWLF